tara:strand:+ start:1353 stop:1622 length:270 start_codon:yes stop_codon:yes gene_type:complete
VVNEVLRGEASWPADYGDEGVSISDLGDRRYVLTCIGLDVADYEVDVTLHVNGCSQPFPLPIALTWGRGADIRPEEWRLTPCSSRGKRR